jgi:glycosyltransferase involved in cell wall biosynthesis
MTSNNQNQLNLTYIKQLIAESLFKLNPKLFRILLRTYKTTTWIPHLIIKLFSINVLIPKSDQRTIYLVTSKKSHAFLKAGISRVEIYLNHKLTSRTYSPFRVIPVFWDGINFALNDNSFKFALQKKYFFKQNFIWNPKKDDILFFQTFSLVDVLDKRELESLKNKCKLVVSVYDIFPITNPEWFKEYMAHSFIRNFDTVFNIADFLIVNSKQTKNEIEAYVRSHTNISGANIPQIKQVNLWSVATPHSRELLAKEENLKRTSNLFPNSNPTLLLVSTVEPRKGHDQLINSAKQAWANGAKFNLLFVGQLGWISNTFKAEFKEFLEVEKDRSIWLSQVKDEDLEEYFRISDILVSPSLGEGYGLPIAEALQRNLPVLASALATYQEVFGKYVVLYGADENYYSLAEALEDIENVLTLGRSLIHTNKLPEIDTVSELLKSFGEI